MNAIRLPLIAALFFACGASAQPFNFVRIETNIPPLNYGDVEFVDLNEDGKLDIVAIGNSANQPPFLTAANIALNTGEVLPSERHGFEQLFTIAPLTSGAWHGMATTADVDSDGHLDVLAVGAATVAAPFSGTAHLFLGDGNGVLSQTATALTGMFGSATAWADFDNDGDPDLVAMGVQDGDTYVTHYYRNDGGILTPVDSGLPDLAYGDVDWGDYDGDGDADLIISGAAQNGALTTDIYANTGEGIFEAMSFNFSRPVFSTVDFGDYDNDGDLDVVLGGGIVSARLFDGVLEVYRNDGPSFAKLATNLRGVFYGDAQWGDYDNDGDLDILAFGGEQAVGRRSGRIYENIAGAFEHRVTFPGFSFSDAAWGDYDADGDLDFVVSGVDRENRPVINLYRNESRLVNSPPEAPSGLQSVASGGTVVLSWERGVDDQTPAEGLTYNVRIGTQSGATDVKNPLASDAGVRWVGERGNADHSTNIRTRLPPGAYFWSVQSVDASFVGSAFATEQTFSVTSSDVSTDLTDDTVPEGIVIVPPFPNPFRDRTTLQLFVSVHSPGRIRIYNTIGARVAEYALAPPVDGLITWSWDGTAQGAPLADGVYFIRATVGGYSAATRVMMLR